MDTFIPLSVPNLSGNELNYVKKAVETEWVSTVGSYVTDFEAMVARYVGAPGAVSCQNGTSGLHISMLLCGVQRGDLVLAPALTFIAAVNPISYLGAEPVFMDCDESLCMDPVKARRFCEEECDFDGNELRHKATGKPVRAISLVHVFGNMADMPAFLQIARDYHLRLIEDATEALGTRFTDGRCGNAYAGTMGDMGVYSFNGNKIITTGGGGMIVSQNEELLRHAKHLTTQAKSDPLNFKHDEIGFNYRLTNLQAALGLAQMEQLETFIDTKIRNYRLYGELLRDIPHVKLYPFGNGIRSNHWFYSLYLEDAFPLSRDALIAHFKANDIQTRPIWGLICDQLPYQGKMRYHVEKARMYEQHVVNLPCSTNLTEEGVNRVVEVLKRCM